MVEKVCFENPLKLKITVFMQSVFFENFNIFCYFLAFNFFFSFSDFTKYEEFCKFQECFWDLGLRIFTDKYRPQIAKQLSRLWLVDWLNKARLLAEKRKISQRKAVTFVLYHGLDFVAVQFLWWKNDSNYKA